ncbi:hypothetical protein MKW92_040537, partial [Papaver armeniacum]
MVEARNRIKGKAIMVVEKLKDKETSNKEVSQMGLFSGGNLVIIDNIQVDLREAVRRMVEAEEYQKRANKLLGFSINTKEPERKKR